MSMDRAQAAYDSDSGTNSAQELAQEWVAEHICDVCLAHPNCEEYGDPGWCPCLRGALVLGREAKCRYYDDEVAKRMEAMRDE
jgi:hypothetical protein